MKNNFVEQTPYDKGRAYCKKMRGMVDKDKYLYDNPYAPKTDEYTQWRKGFKDERVSHLEGYEEYYS